MEPGSSAVFLKAPMHKLNKYVCVLTLHIFSLHVRHWEFDDVFSPYKRLTVKFTLWREK